MTIHLLPTLASIANIIDMINPRLNLHHVRTAFIASHLANLVGFSAAQRRKTILAALIHDVGGLNEKSRLEPLNYIDNEHNNHALIGSELLNRIPLFRPLNRIVRYHHTAGATVWGIILKVSGCPKRAICSSSLTGWMYFIASTVPTIAPF